MKTFRLALELIPRISVLLILTPILINIGSYIALLYSLPAIASKSLDLASRPILIMVSIITGVAALINPSPSLYALLIFFIALSDPRVLVSIGISTAIFALAAILMADSVRGLERLSGSSYVSIESRARSSILGFSIAIALLVGIPLLISLYIASFISAYKIQSTSPYLAPIASFLSTNPAGSIIMASILLAVFYMIARLALDVIVLYIAPSPRVAIADLSSAAKISWVRPPLGFLRGFILSSIVSPPLYYILREILAGLGLMVLESSWEMYGRIISGAIGLAIFIAIWSLLSRGFFSEERDPSLRGSIYLSVFIMVVYVASLYISSRSSAGFDGVLSPIAEYYRDIWVVLELIIRAIGASP
jgi:hypothetical protein